jgi:hypothetical protein
MPAIPPDLESVTVDLAVDGRWVVRLRRLTTTDAARAGVLVELLAALTMAEDRQAVARQVSPDRLAQVDQMASKILCECVEAGSLDGSPFEPLRLVPERKQHDPEASPARLWVGRIPGHQRGALAAQAMLLHAEAEGILRPFRLGAERGPDAAQRQPGLRADAAGVADAP